jgi:hypothetical protein
MEDQMIPSSMDLGRRGRRADPSRVDLRGTLATSALAGAALTGALLLACANDDITGPSQEVLDRGREIFRFDSFGDERFWTDTLRMHEVIQEAVTPAVALSVGLKVDADALPESLKNALPAGQVDLNSTATRSRCSSWTRSWA